MGTTDGNGVYTPDLDEEGWDAEVATNFTLFSQNITDTAAHIADTTAAHAASAISFSPTGTVAATTVQTAIAEVASEAAPTGADYLVGTTQGGLSAEIVVGATPGGELGGTWGSPTVDSSHAGGTHAATQAAAEATAASALTTHAGAADPHTGYVLESLFDAKGDLLAASADNTPAKVTAGANGTALMADSTQSAGVKWVAPATNGALTADVTTSETTASTSYTDLATSGPAVTVVAPLSGIILVTVSASITNNAAAFNSMSFAQDAGSPADVNRAHVSTSAASTPNLTSTRQTLVTGLTPGTSYVFTAKYKVSAGTGTFFNRRIIGIPL